MCHSVACSYACPARSTVASSNGRPANCSEIGSPARVNPHGSASAGSPLRLKGGMLLSGKPTEAS